jgi:hypothetical protein
MRRTELPDRLEGNTLIGSLIPTFWTSMQFLLWSSVQVVEVVQKYNVKTSKSIHGMSLILGYRQTRCSKNDFCTVLCQIVPKTVLWTIKTNSVRFIQTKLSKRYPDYIEHMKLKSTFYLYWCHGKSLVGGGMQCLELCSCCLMLYPPPPYSTSYQRRVPLKTFTWIVWRTKINTSRENFCTKDQ